MRVERVRRDAMDLASNVGSGRDRTSEIEETEPPVGDTGQEKMSGVGKESQGGDNFRRCVLLQDTAVRPWSHVSAWNTWMRTGRQK